MSDGKGKNEREIRTNAKNGSVEIERAEEPLPVRWVSGNGFARRTAREMGKAVSEYIPKVALPISPYRFAARHLFWMFISLPFALAAPLLAVLLHPLFLLLTAVPLVAFASPWLRLKILIGDRKREAKEELPFFTVHAAIGQTAGFGLYQSLKATIGSGVFKQVERSAKLAKRNVEVLSRSPLEALEELGKSHPERQVKSLLLGYTSEQRSGGDLVSFLESKAQEYLRKGRRRWEGYRRNVGTVAELVITGLFIIPIMVLMAAFLSPNAAGTLGFGFIAIGIPLILALCAVLIQNTQPQDYTEYPNKLVLPVIATPIVFVLLLNFIPHWVALSFSVGTGLILYGIPVAIRRRRVLAEEDSLPDFLRDVTEYQKLDYPFRKAIGRLYREREYTDAFQEVLGSVANQLETGRSLSDVDVPTESWLTRLVFFHLGEVAESGGFAIRSTEMLTEFITEIKNTRDEVVSDAKLYRYISMSTPVVLTLVAAGMSAMFGLFAMPEMAGGTTDVGVSGLSGMMKEPPLFDLIAKVMILISSIGVTALTSYASELTPKNLTWSGIAAILSGAGIWLMPRISEYIQAFLGFG